MLQATGAEVATSSCRTVLSSARAVVLSLVLLVVCIVKLVPFWPNMPSPTLESWAYAMNQAMAQGLALGTDIVFTFGPYSAIYTRSYHPFTDVLMLCGGFYLALMLWISCVGVMRQRAWYWQLLFVAGFALLASAIDTLLFFIPMVAGLQVWRWVSAESAGLRSPWAALQVALLFLPFGLLPLVKGSLLLLCLVICVLSSLLFWLARYRRLAAVCLAAPLLGMLAFWAASAQPMAALPAYFTSMGPIISGYTNAMSLGHSKNQVALCLAPCILILLVLWRQPGRFAPASLFLAALLAVFLFLSFKAGFVRQDAHVLICSEAVLLTALMLPFVLRSRLTPAILALALCCWGVFDRTYVPIPYTQALRNVASLYVSAWEGAQHRLADAAWPRSQLQQALNAIQHDANIPLLAGSMDTYSYHQSQLFASGNHWSPRPVLQSYSAYTEELAEMNRAHLTQSRAPDHIVFGIEPIDGRLPALEDGPSWPELLTRYQPVRMLGDTLLLDKVQAPTPLAPFAVLQEGDHTLGQEVALPAGQDMVFAQLDVRLSWLGRLAALLFKPTDLQVTLQFEDGHRQSFRLIPGMAKAGFIISPYIDSAADFALMYGRPALLRNNRVSAMIVAPASGTTRQWGATYHASFRKVPALPPRDISAVRQFDVFESSNEPAALTECEGVIDDIKAPEHAPLPLVAGGRLKANGWLALSIARASLAEEVYLVLTDAQGVRHYAKAHPVKRPDVAAYFKQPAMENSGYTVSADLNGLLGDFTLGLAVRSGGERKICPAFNIPVNIVP